MAPRLFSTNRSRIVVILASNFLISVLQSNLASLFSLVGPDFTQGVAGLGLASSLMFLGICVAEIPGGVLEARIGARNAIAYMMFLCAASSILGSLTTNFSIFLVTRFAVGVGIGGAFPPVIVILTRYFKSGSEGAAIGWNSLSYNLGSVIGLAGWAILGSIMGWRLSLLLGGLLSAGLGILMVISLPRLETGLQNFKLSIRDLRLAFSNRQISLLTIALFGIGASSNITSNFLVYFLETEVRLPPGEAGLIGGVGPLFAFTAPFIGKYYDRIGRLKMWMLFSSIMVAGGVAVTTFGTPSAGILSSVLVAIGASTGYTIGLTKVRQIGKSIRNEYESVTVAWTDSISLLGGFVAPVLFSVIVTSAGYHVAWPAGALFALVLVFALYL
jgi:MFS family permease